MRVIRNYLLQIFPYVLILVLLLTSIFYFLKLAFTDGKVTQPNTFESWLMIPSILKEESLETIGEVKDYHYAAGEASSPSVSEVFILAKGDRDSIERKVRYYFISHGFRKNDQGEFKKGREKFDFIIEKKGHSEWMIAISLLES